jgi:hypothetical protein
MCGLECPIEQIEFHEYDEDDPEGFGLKMIRFTADGEPVEWFLGPDAGEKGGLQLLIEHFQSFFRERFKNRQLYETDEEYVLLFLSDEAAEKIGKLVKLYPHPERDK